ncbi:electron transporter SenC [Rhodothermaceae bacterium RA]|nr:electron transporter SenC [Rhodothermaceae bacterium RA]
MRFVLRHSVMVAAVLLAGLSGGQALAQRSGQLPPELADIGVEERLGETIPMDLTFVDEAGQEVTLGAYFGRQKPVLMTLVYHDCPMLCSLILDFTTEALRELDWTPGEAFEMVTVSFNAIETPALARKQKERYLDKLGRPAAAQGWHFLTGDEAAIHALTEAVGFRYRWDEASQQFAHPAVLIFVSPDGRITRYLNGLSVPARDVRMALVEASNGEVGTLVDQFFQYCFQYDPEANTYVAHAQNLMRLGGGLAVLIFGLVLVMFWRREVRRLDEPVVVS